MPVIIAQSAGQSHHFLSHHNSRPQLIMQREFSNALGPDGKMNSGHIGVLSMKLPLLVVIVWLLN